MSDTSGLTVRRRIYQVEMDIPDEYADGYDMEAVLKDTIMTSLGRTFALQNMEVRRNRGAEMAHANAQVFREEQRARRAAAEQRRAKRG